MSDLKLIQAKRKAGLSLTTAEERLWGAASRAGLVPAGTPQGAPQTPSTSGSEQSDSYPELPPLTPNQQQAAEVGQALARQGGKKLGMSLLPESIRKVYGNTANSRSLLNFEAALDAPRDISEGLGQIAAMAYGKISPEKFYSMPGVKKAIADTKARKARRDAAGPAGIVSNIAGNILTLGAGGGPAEAAMAGGGGALRQALVASLMGGGEAALQPTEAPEERTTNTVSGAALGGVLSLAGSGAGKVLTQPFAPKPAAQALLDEGIVPTVGQGSKNTLLSSTEEMLSGFGPVARARQRTVDQVADRIADVSLPPGKTWQGAKPKAGSEDFFRQTKKMFDDAYAAVKAKFPSVTVDPAILDSFEDYGIPTPRTLRALVNKGSLSGEEFKQLDQELRKIIDIAYSTRDPARIAHARDALLTARDDLRSLLPNDVASEYRRIDNAYRNRATLVDSVYNSMKTVDDFEGINPRALSNAVMARGSKEAAVTGRLPHQKIVQGLTDIQDPSSSRWELRNLRALGIPVIAGLAGGPAHGVGSAAGMVGTVLAGTDPRAARALLGDYEVQKQLAEFLRRGPIAGTIGATAAGALNE